MAHFVRPLALAEALDSSKYDLCFYAPARFFRYLRDKPFTTGEVASMPGEQFLANIVKGVPLFPTKVIHGYENGTSAEGCISEPFRLQSTAEAPADVWETPVSAWVPTSLVMC